MTNDAITSFLDAQERLRRQMEPFSAALRAIEMDSSVRQLAKQVQRQDEIMRVAFGPVEELRRVGVLSSASQLATELAPMRGILEQTQARFRLPEMNEAGRLLRELDASRATVALNRFHLETAGLQRAMEAMRAPWLDIQDTRRSVACFAELHRMGHVLRIMPAFSADLTEALRIDLGDWQKKVRWPPAIFTDPLARTAFYMKRGLDPALSAFPAAAFEESMRSAGLKESMPPLIETYDYEPPADEDEEEETAFERTNAAHDRLQRFETQLRRFIDERMKETFGENWIKHQVPGRISHVWREKRRKAIENGEESWPLIAYADFADYTPVITRKDNWDAVFKPVFRRQTSVQESFQRLIPIRICTMHARLITQDDELYLYVETKRILAAIGITA